MSTWEPDILGPGFAACRLDLPPDADGERRATLVRYVPEEDPYRDLPDRLVPDNLRRGGGASRGGRVDLGPAASPQRLEEVQGQPGFPRCWPGRTDVSGLYVSPNAALDEVNFGADQKRAAAASAHARAALEADPKVFAVLEPADYPPHFAVLYVHGWNDYFAQAHLARVFHRLGAAFYAVDLSRYGRNKPAPGSGVTLGYTRDFRGYVDDLDAAAAVIAAEHPGLPLLGMGHSNGGMVVSLWASLTKVPVAGLVFNSPWVATDGATIPAGFITRPLIKVLGRLTPRLGFPRTQKNLYGHSLAGFRTPDAPLPERLAPYASDPCARGWWFSLGCQDWPTAPLKFGWFRAVLQAQQRVAEGFDFDFPILGMVTNPHAPAALAEELAAEDAALEAAARAGKLRACSKGFRAELRHIDSVLNPALLAQTLRTKFGAKTQVVELSGVHDLTLGDPEERLEVWRTLAKWIGENFPTP